MFSSTISAKLLRISRATTSYPSFIVVARTLMIRMKKQGADVLDLKKILLYRRENEFSKYLTETENILFRFLE